MLILISHPSLRLHHNISTGNNTPLLHLEMHEGTPPAIKHLNRRNVHEKIIPRTDCRPRGFIERITLEEPGASTVHNVFFETEKPIGLVVGEENFRKLFTRNKHYAVCTKSVDDSSDMFGNLETLTLIEERKGD